MNFRIACMACTLAATGLASPVQAQTSVIDAIAKGRLVIDLRGRYETVSDASKAVDANALTLRARLGYETGSWNGLSLQTDFDQIWAIGGAAYNSTRNGKTAYAVVADPAMTALNRLQLTYASDFDTKFVVGRQRLLIGNQRFVGNSGWRQHEQTFDSISAVNMSVPGLALTYAYLYRINRVYGPDVLVPSNTPAAATGQANYFKSDSHVFDGVYTGVPGCGWRVTASSWICVRRAMPPCRRRSQPRRGCPPQPMAGTAITRWCSTASPAKSAANTLTRPTIATIR